MSFNHSGNSRGGMKSRWPWAAEGAIWRSLYVLPALARFRTVDNFGLVETRLLNPCFSFRSLTNKLSRGLAGAKRRQDRRLERLVKPTRFDRHELALKYPWRCDCWDLS